jgi:hypothetical protein
MWSCLVSHAVEQNSLLEFPPLLASLLHDRFRHSSPSALLAGRWLAFDASGSCPPSL